MKSDDHEKLILTSAIVIGGGIALHKIFVALGFSKTDEQKQQEQQEDNAIKDKIAEVLAVQNPTKSLAEWQGIANLIYEDLKYSAIDDNKSDATYQLCRVKNDADFWTLLNFFGKRQEYFFGIPTGDKKNILTFVRTNLSKDQIATINDNYRNKNINFRY